MSLSISPPSLQVDFDEAMAAKQRIQQDAEATQRRMAGYVLPASESKPYGELSQENQERVELVFKRFDTDCDMNISVRNSPPQR